MNSWLINKKADLLLFFLPIWLVLIYCFALPQEILAVKMSITIWVIFILGIDVSHVWSTIFRTYFDKEEYQQHKRILKIAPLLAVALVSAVSAVSEVLFWSLLAYYALFHFVKQQYGFFALYKRKAKFDDSRFWVKSSWLLYIGVLYPVVYWHLSGDRAFYWFEGGDFLRFSSEGLQPFLGWCSVMYLLLHVIWFTELVVRKIKVPVGMTLWLLTSSLVWYVGIVWFNSDVVFSLTNVVSHGVPYMVLVFYYVEVKKSIKNKETFKLSNKTLSAIGAMILIVLLLALTEEYFWDWVINKEKSEFFEAWFDFPFQVNLSYNFRMIIISILSIPQITHYILDSYIWKGNAKNPYVKKVFLEEFNRGGLKRKR